MARFVLTIVLSWVLAVSAFAAETDAPAYRLNYSQCVALAYKNNNQIRAAEQDIQVSEGKVFQSHPRSIPVVKYEGRLAPVPQNIDDAASSFFSGEISPFTSLKIEVGAPISTFGKIKTAQTLAETGVAASQFKKQKTSDDIAFTIYQLYQGILLARELLGLAQQAQDAMQGKMEQLEKEQVPDQLGILKLKVASYEVERKVEEARKKEGLAIWALKMQMGMEDGVNFNIADSKLAVSTYSLKSMDYYLSKFKEYLPDYQLLGLGLSAKENQLKLQKIDPIPNVGVGGFFDIGYAPNLRGDDDENNFTNPFDYKKAGIGLQIKGEFDYVKTTALIRQNKADVLKTVYERRAAIRALELDLRKTYLDVKEAQSLMAKAGDEKKAARQIVFLTKSNLDIGVGERKDYLDALQSYLIFQGREYEAIFNYNVAVSNLRKRTGELTAPHRKDSSS